MKIKGRADSNHRRWYLSQMRGHPFLLTRTPTTHKNYGRARANDGGNVLLVLCRRWFAKTIGLNARNQSRKLCFEILLQPIKNTLATAIEKIGNFSAAATAQTFKVNVGP